MDRAAPDDLRGELLGRSEAALRALDRVLKALRQLQLDRRARGAQPAAGARGALGPGPVTPNRPARFAKRNPTR